MDTEVKKSNAIDIASVFTETVEESRIYEFEVGGDVKKVRVLSLQSNIKGEVNFLSM